MPGKNRQQLQEEFDEGVKRLWIFYEREGHCHVHREHKEDDGYFLGRFVKNTLSKYKNKYLSDENIAKVEELPGWQWSPKTSNQNKKLSRLVRVLTDFHKEHGHLWVPVDMEVEGENILKAMQYFRGRYHTRNPKKKEIEALESIPGWTWETPETSHTLEEKWERKYQLLIKYALMNGHTFVPQLFELEGEKLGQWTERQRKQYENGDLMEHRQKRLETLPLWEWHKPDNEDYFNSAFVCLMKYFQENGPKMPPKDYKTPHGTGLNEWILSQRARYKSGNMPIKKIRRLEAIPGWAWSSKDQRWMDYYSKLKDFNTKFSHCEVPDTYRAEGKRLRWWVNKSRRRYVLNELTDQQKHLLEQLYGWQDFLKKSGLYLKSLDQNPTEKAIFPMLDENPELSAKEIAAKSGYSYTSCRKYLKLYFENK